MICFVVSGLWHGANWTFVVWGMYHGAFLILDRTVLAGRWQRVPVLIRIVMTFLLVVVGWVIFRCPTISQAFDMIMAMVDPRHGVQLPSALHVGSDIYFFLALGMLMAFMPSDPLAWIWGDREGQSWSRGVCRDLSVSVLLFVGIGWVLATSFHPFIYFRF
jgi:alginate O-acetyltransferase complex protein AlgI